MDTPDVKMDYIGLSEIMCNSMIYIIFEKDFSDASSFTNPSVNENLFRINVYPV